MSLFDIYKAIKVGRSDSLFASVVGTKLNKDAWKKGFNKWDEEWELGTFNTTTGASASSTTQIRTKNYIDVVGGETYFCNANPRVWCLFFDGDKNAISSGAGAGYNVSGNSVQLGFDINPLAIPSNARYMRFYCQASYGATYKNDICINISGEHDGEYVPYNG